MKVLLAGGGTAGHTSPLLATADALVRLDPGTEITCLGTPRGLEKTVVPAAGYPLELIPPVPLPRRPNKDLALLPSRLRGAVRATYDVLDRVQPDVVVGYGGYVSVPAYLAARRRRLPLVIHEQNALPGIGNKLGARVATRVAVSFPDTPLKEAEYVGLPLRRMISQLDRSALRAEARAFFGLDPDLPTLVVTGGSQGAWKLNRAVARASAALGAAGVQVLHVIGARGKEDPEWVEPDNKDTPSVPYLVVPFVDRMDYALAAADLMVCRAGANSVVEAAATGVPAIFVPLAHGNGEQAHNARPVVDAGGALMAEEAAFTPDYVAVTVPAIAKDPARLAAMSAAASSLVPADADERLARIITESAAPSGRRR
jgi:UDP-N-acetylglucosamine--N-acetylmuramyl-(pentapeptide) pyrophosphoryl-undecaprenol N-acetylglucosamine transferase